MSEANKKSLPKHYIKRIKMKRKDELERTLDRLERDPKYQDLMQNHRNRTYGGAQLFLDTEESQAFSEDREIFTRAELLMEQLANDEISLGSLSLASKCDLFYFLEKYNKRVGRINDIQTRIPLSSIRLSKPKTQNPIVDDYIYKKFNDIFNSSGFQNMLENVVKQYWLFGFASVLIEDNYEYIKESDILDNICSNSDLKDLPIGNRERVAQGEDKKARASDEEINSITSRYLKSPSSVSWSDRERVIESLLYIHSPDYRGIVKSTVLPVYSTLEREENCDTNYSIYTIQLSDSFIKTYDNVRGSIEGTKEETKTILIKEMEKVGYTRAMVETYMDYMDEFQEVSGIDKLLIDTDPYNPNGMYVAVFQRTGLSNLDNSPFNRVLQDAIDLHLASRRMRQKVNKGFKKNIVISTGEQEDIENIQELQAHIEQSAQEEEGSVIVTNMQVNASDIDLNVQGQIELSELIDDKNRGVAEGVGIPESIISDSTEAYSNSFLKTLMLENEFLKFRNNFGLFLEDHIFKPMAIKFGFIHRNEWGEIEPIYPKIKYNRMSLARGSDDLIALTELANDGKLSMDIIYDTLGLDKEEVVSQLRKEKLTLLNPEISDAYTASIKDIYGESIAKSESVKKIVSENLDLKEEDLKIEESDDRY